MADWQIPEGERARGSLDKLVGVMAGPVGWLVFNNPERRNAVSRAMWDAVPGLLDEFSANANIRVIVLTGAGGKAFVSGADISEFKEQRESAKAEAAYSAASQGAFAAIASCPIPTLAMINGACVGGGLATALSCDIRVASEGSRLGVPAARLGIGYPLSGIETLVSLVRPANAKQLLYTAELLPANRAHEMGLINEVVPAERLGARVSELIEMIAANAPLSQAAAKIAIDHVVSASRGADDGRVQAAIDRAMTSDDVKEGHQAFLEKRKPVFRGR